jgi:hypothetical protein
MPSVLRSAVLLARHALVALAMLAVLATALGLHPHQDCPDRAQEAVPCCAHVPADGGHGDDGDPADPSCDHCHCPPAAPMMAPAGSILPASVWRLLRQPSFDQRIPASVVHQPDPPPVRA